MRERGFLQALVMREEGCDPGADACPAYLCPQTAQHNAGTALVRLCSDPRTTAPDVPAAHGVALPEGGNLRSLVEVARKRLGDVMQSCGDGCGGGGTVAHVAMARRLDAIERWPWELQ